MPNTSEPIPSVAEYVNGLLATAPEFSDAQRERLRELLAGRSPVYRDASRELAFREDQAARARRRDAARRLLPLDNGMIDPDLGGDAA